MQDLNLANAFTENISSARYFTHIHEIFMESNFSRLEFIDLTGNELSVLNPRNHRGAPDHDIFCEMPNVEIIYLIRNELKNLHVDPTCLKKLRQLRLDYNKFQYLNNEDIESIMVMPEISVLNISRNPFVCDCHSKDFIRWIRENSRASRIIPDRKHLSCFTATPDKFEGWQLVDVDPEALECPLKAAIVTRRHASYTVLSIMLVALFSLMIVIVYSARRHIAVKLLHIVRRTTYKHLDSEVSTLQLSDQPNEATEFDV